MKIFVILLLAAVGACTTLPAPHLAPEATETAATVDELGPGQYHILVRINYFAADDGAERLLRARAATLCGDEAVHIDHLAIARQPAMAAADVTCGDPKEGPPAGATPPGDTDNGATPAAVAPETE